MHISAELESRIDEAITHYPVSKRSAVMTLLHLIQENLGFISDESVTWVARKLGLEPVNVLEVVSFYPMYRRKPAGKKHIRVCRTLSCAMAGGYELKDAICKTAHIHSHDHGDHGDPVSASADGEYSVEFVECLASCGSAPVAMVDDRFYENVKQSDIVELLKGQRGSDATLPRVRPPHPKEKRLVFANIDKENWTPDIECYARHGGYGDLKKALTMPRATIVDEVKKSGLRGRGGAGFPCGVKWGFIKPDEKKPVYLICNADESEPGTFKDRQIIHKDPHQLIEGMIISCFANDVKLAYIYIRGEMPKGAKLLNAALKEARAKSFLGKNILGSGYDLEIYVHRGAGAYICGEETGLIESLEGKRPYPRIKPPYFPAVLGLYMCPTIVNNVETLCNVKHIVTMGGAEFAKLGTPNNTGTRIVSLSGQVKRPGYYEIEVGKATIGQLINDPAFGGGLRDGRKLKAVIPGGSSSKVLKAGEKFKLKRKVEGKDVEVETDMLDLPYDFDSLQQAGTMSGSSAIIVIDDSVDIVGALANLSEFYAHESCGQCTPCREGSLWMSKTLHRLTHGEGRKGDADYLVKIADNIPGGKTICAFGEACSWPVQSFVAKFKDEFVAKGAADEERRTKEKDSAGSQKH